MNSVWSNILTWLPRLLAGAGTTVWITAVTMALSIAWGLALALIRIARIPIVHMLVVCYVEFFRGLPTIVVLFLVFFGLPSLGFNISRSPAIVGVFGLTLSMGAYLSEVFRAAVLAIDSGQMLAAESLGMSRVEGYRHVVLPQALLVAVPSVGSFFIGLIKDTSLLSFISVSELMQVGNSINAATFLSFQVYFTVGIIYIILSLAASRLVLYVESKLRWMNPTPPRRRSSALGRIKDLRERMGAAPGV